MPITFDKGTALRILRAMRSGSLSMPGRRARTGIVGPTPPEGVRWTRRRVLSELPGVIGASLGDAGVDVAVPRVEDRLKAKGVRNTVYEKAVLGKSFILLRDGLAIPTPELLFFEMREEHDVLGLALLGMELCGGYALPWNGVGKPAYGVKPVTTAERLRSFIRRAPSLPGIDRAREAAGLVQDNCWSPMEAPLVAFAGDGPDGLGFGIGKVIVNRREGARDPSLASKESRVPDIMFEDTPVGINYDGGGHYDIDRVARAALAAACEVGRADIWKELEAVKREVRAKYADDRRRERDLWADGLTVFTATKEDLYEEGALDLLMAQVIEAIHRTTGRDMGRQREVLLDPETARRRQELLRSALS